MTRLTKQSANANAGPASVPPGKDRLTLAEIRQTGGSLTIRDISPVQWFPAGQPVRPVAPAGTPPRRMAYQPLANINFSGRDGQVDFNTIRQFSYYPIIRFILETVKDRVCHVRWQFRPRQRTGESKVAFRKRAKADARVDEIKRFLSKPDGWQRFRTWLRGLLDDMLVIDAASVWLQQDQDKKICGLVQIDGAQVFPLIDETGQQPASHLVQTGGKKASKDYLAKKKKMDAKGGSPAFQLTPYGFPAQQLMDTEFIYAVRNRLTYRKYGFSPVEQALVMIALALGRLDFQAAFYRSGMSFEFIAFMPPDVPITKVEEVNGYLDSILSGNARNRRKGFFLPSYGGDKQPNIIFPKLNDTVLKDDFDDWLARVFCYCLGMSPTAFVKQVNRATAQNMSETAEIEGLEPYVDWCKDLLDEVLEKVGYGDMEAVPEPHKTEDVAKAAQADASNFGHGLQTWNDIAESNGMDQIDAPWADQHFIITPTGAVPLEVTDQMSVDDFKPHGPPASPDQKPDGKDGGPGASPPKGKGKPPKAGSPGPPADRGRGKAGKLAKGSRPRISPELTRNSEIAKARLQLSLRACFAKAKALVIEHAPELMPVDKAAGEARFGDSEYWNRIAREFEPVIGESQGALVMAGESGGMQGALSLDMSDSPLVADCNKAASEYARNRAAEMVGKRVLPDGSLVDNPDAKWAITDTTRDDLNSILVKALSEATDAEGLKASVKEALEKGEAGIFSDARAELIARQEVSNAQMGSALDFWKRSGVVKKIGWDATGANPCENCLLNDGEEVELGQPFPSGARSTLDSHVRCSCSIFVVGTEEEE